MTSCFKRQIGLLNEIFSILISQITKTPYSNYAIVLICLPHKVLNLFCMFDHAFVHLVCELLCLFQHLYIVEVFAKCREISSISCHHFKDSIILSMEYVLSVCQLLIESIPHYHIEFLATNNRLKCNFLFLGTLLLIIIATLNIIRGDNVLLSFGCPYWIFNWFWALLSFTTLTIKLGRSFFNRNNLFLYGHLANSLLDIAIQL